jgi:hypothetical protein
VRSSPACRTERKRSPEQPGPKGNAQYRLLSEKASDESQEKGDDAHAAADRPREHLWLLVQPRLVLLR